MPPHKWVVVLALLAFRIGQFVRRYCPTIFFGINFDIKPSGGHDFASLPTPAETRETRQVEIECVLALYFRGLRRKSYRKIEVAFVDSRKNVIRW